MEINSQYFAYLCRTCMNKVGAYSPQGNTMSQQEWLSIFDTIEECGDLRIAELLSDTVPQIVVQQSDELPKKICNECLQQLLSVNRFQQMCLQSDKQMHELLSKNQTVLKTPMLEEAIKCEIETNDVDSQPSKNFTCSSTLQNLEQPSIQEALAELTDQITEQPEAAQTSAVDHLLNKNLLLEHCEEFVKNEPIEDDNTNSSEYNDWDTMISAISVTKDEPMELEDQQINVTSTRHNCHFCCKSYKKREYLRRHLNEHIKKLKNSEEYCYACHLCSESYKEERYLSRHLYVEHSKKSLDDKSNTETEDKQKKNVTSALHQCHLCNKSYEKRAYLKRHLNDHKKKANNSEEYCHVCHLCSESYKEERFLMRHLKKEHSIQLQRNTCHICNKSFKAPVFLRRHLPSHTGERPYSCSKCGKSFSLKSILAAHLKSHSGDTPSKNHINANTANANLFQLVP